MRDTRPMNDRQWSLHMQFRRMRLADVITAFLIGVALAVLFLLYCMPCEPGSLC